MGLGLGLAIGGMLAGTTTSAYSQYKQGQAASKMHRYNRAVSLRYAKAIREIKAHEISTFLRQAKKFFPKQKVVAAAAGLETSGTVLSVMKETRAKILEQTEIMQYERDMEIAQIKAGADISGMRASLAASAGRFGAFSTILTGVAQVGMMSYKYGGSAPPTATIEQQHYGSMANAWLTDPYWEG